MPNLQTASVASVGGLDQVSPPNVLSQKPGSAVILQNFESLPEGGFRRIHGYTPLTKSLPHLFSIIVCYYHSVAENSDNKKQRDPLPVHGYIMILSLLWCHPFQFKARHFSLQDTFIHLFQLYAT